MFPKLAGRFFTTDPPGKPQVKTNLWNAAKALWKGNFIAINAHAKKGEKSILN